MFYGGLGLWAQEVVRDWSGIVSSLGGFPRPIVGWIVWCMGGVEVSVWRCGGFILQLGGQSSCLTSQLLLRGINHGRRKCVS